MRMQSLLGTLLLILAGGVQFAQAADLARAPLSAGARVDPNLMFIIDDSGSMRFENMPESNIAESARFIYPRPSGIYGSGSYSNIVPNFDQDDAYNAYSRSPQVNALYYNPAVTYQPWFRADGSRMQQANPINAYHNPSSPYRGGRNLTFENTQSADGWVGDCDNINEAGPEGCETTPGREVVCRWFGCYYQDAEVTFYPATYYTYTGGGYGDIENYRRVEIRSGRGSFDGEGRENRSDCANASANIPSCTYDEEMQNFANWYSYYRSRTLAARAGIGEAFSQLGETIRVGFDTINSNGNVIQGDVSKGVRVFKGEGRSGFFDELYTHEVPAEGTPLRRGLQRSGSYFENHDEPWRDDPSSDQSRDFQSCRANYSLLMSDGYWSGNNPPGINNADGTQGPSVEGPDGQTYRYPATAPYADDVSSTLADVAMHYWKRDLRGDKRNELANDVPVNAQDPAFWQHMTTFGVGFGVAGSIDPDSAWQAVKSGASVDWPSASDFNSRDSDTANRARLDDLLHASINGHGGFFNASNPQAFVEGLNTVLGTIVSRQEASVVPVAVSSDTIGPDTQLFSAGFRSTDWSGELKGYQLLPGGARDLEWDAELRLREQSPGDRLLLTWKGESGQTLSTVSSDLSADQIRWLKGESVDGLRGRIPDGQEAPNLLGDIVNSAPFLLTPPDGSDRAGMVFVGANDGMLHGFSAETGKELFAYLPGELVNNRRGNKAPLESLMNPDYTHRYFVDGSPVARNVDIEGGPDAVVVGTMGAGGRTVFALDVSDPENMSADDVLWEFSDAALGEGVTQPSISQISYKGKPRWVALFGNGYNSEAQQAVMFAVDLQTGEVLKRLDTGVGGADSPNGLAPPTATRWPAYNGLSQYAYAGDLQGNMWRFDLSDLSSSPQRLLEGQASQPITAPAQLEFKPGDSGALVVLFGTGSFQFVDDRNDTNIQRLYGLLDRSDENLTAVSASAPTPTLAPQILSIDKTSDGQEVRTGSNNLVGSTQQGWYIDLPAGERLVSQPTLPAGIYHKRALFSTLRPLFGQCTAGVDGYVYSLRLETGGSGTTAFFDTNGDGKVDSGDNLADANGDPKKVVTGIKLGNGESQVVVRDPETGQGVLAGTIGSVGGTQRTGVSGAASGRQSWRQIFEP
ncbi:pilus assembly protein [Onishia niordana]|uniref:pilus assembly protein n=1 Tax=Onishia niordana TaxID=2508711 RepID=UPI0010A06B9C|nr:PilC/PilY family type IV pilus protein [Halomonas niordiana]